MTNTDNFPLSIFWDLFITWHITLHHQASSYLSEYDENKWTCSAHSTEITMKLKKIATQGSALSHRVHKLWSQYLVSTLSLAVLSFPSCLSLSNSKTQIYSHVSWDSSLRKVTGSYLDDQSSISDIWRNFSNPVGSFGPFPLKHESGHWPPYSIEV
jgi:hypothetical protein